MFLAYLTMLTALTISGVAIFYSVSGLAAIFSAAVIPIIIMGGTLEVAKLVTAVWLHRSWRDSTWWLKGYLSLAVIVLMFITSIGIFGFLSKAHDTATGASAEAIALVDRVDSQIAREQNRIQILQDRINGVIGGATLDNSVAIEQQQEIISGAREAVQSDIDYNQTQITAINTRLDRDLEALESSRAADIKVQTDRLAALDQAVNDLRNRGVETVETDSGGVFRGANVDVIDNNERADALFAQQQPERERIQAAIDRIDTDSRAREAELRRTANESIRTAQANINRYRQQTQTTVDNATAEMNRLREQSINSQDQNLEQVDEWQNQIDSIYDNIAQLRDEKFDAEEQVRSVEREVGPIRYIAEFFSNEEADATMLERAVSWLIIIIIFVFDPLAVLLLIASQYTFERFRKKPEPDPEPEGPHSLEKPEPEPEDPEPNLKGDFPDNDKPLPHPGAPFNFHIDDAEPEPEKKEIELDFSPLQDKIDETRKAFEDWYAENPQEISAEEEVSDENILVSEPEPEPEPEVDVQEFLDKGLVPTDGKTYQRVLGSDYIIDLEGKSIHQDALKTQHPDLFLQVDGAKSVGTSFGTDFPKLATKGDIFVRVDQMPNRVYKFEGHKWMEINKEQSQSYIFDEEYIKYLVSKIETGEYDVDLLSEKEKAEIEEYLTIQQTAQNG